MSTPSNDAALSHAFARAVVERGAAYASVRAEILGNPAAASFLRTRHAEATSWRERLTAEMLLGWLEHKRERDEAFAWLKDKQRRRDGTAVGKAMPDEIAPHIVALGPTIVPWAIEAWLKTGEHEDGWEEAVLVNSLAQLRDRRSFEPALEVLESKSEPDDRRINAAFVLESLGDPRSLPVLERVLRDVTESDAMRKAAAGTLGEQQPAAARIPIEDVLAAPASSAQLKSDLAFELARLRDPASRPALEKELEASDDTLVLYGVTYALGRVGDAGTIKRLRAKMQRKIDGDARESCEEAIREIDAQGERKAQPDF